MKYILSALTVVFLLSSCDSNGQETKKDGQTVAKNVEVAEFESMMTKHPGTVLDVRTADEFNSGHIDNATNIDWYGDDFNTKAETLDKKKPVYVYCHSGGRSKSAMKRLKSLGFEEVYNLSGGITAWNNTHR